MANSAPRTCCQACALGKEELEQEQARGTRSWPAMRRAGGLKGAHSELPHVWYLIKTLNCPFRESLNQPSA